jgi:N-acetylglucosamine kinase-like BadF-type ATPase
MIYGRMMERCMAELILGIDGGGSKTRALVSDRAGTILGTGTAGTSNYQSVGFVAATAALREAVAAALRQAHLDRQTPIAAACFGLAGVGRPPDHDLFRHWLDDYRIAQQQIIVNDAELVLAAGTPAGWGVALICGTGSICFGKAPNGMTARAGGWGYLLGDEGSGYAIALHALRLATQTADGRAAADGILSAVLQHWHLDEPSQLVSYIYRPEVSRTEIAMLARRVIDLAGAGDQDALGIVDAAAKELARLVAVVVQRLSLVESPLALGGGLLGENSCLRIHLLQHAGVPLGPVEYVDDPAVGALVLARQLLADRG